MIHRMTVKWVGGCKTSKTAPDFEENIWILKLWGNPRNIACNSAMWRRQIFGVPLHLDGYNCVAAWYNPINWENIKFKLSNIGI
jgi:hypothetical protein